MIILFDDYPEEFFPILDAPTDCKHPVEDEEEDES